MNTNNVISLPAAVDLTGKEHFCVKLNQGATPPFGVSLCASTEAARLIGTLHRAMPRQEDGVYAGDAVAVFRKAAGIHYAVIGASSAAVAAGDFLQLDAANPGKLIPGGTLAVAVDAFTAADGAIVNVMFL
jgi:hypothetical protein